VVICTISLKKERQLGRESLATVLMLYLCSSPFPYQSWLLWSARLSTLSCDLIPHCFNSQSLTGKKWVVVNWKVGQSLVFCFPTGGETVIASVIVSWRIGEIKNWSTSNSGFLFILLSHTEWIILKLLRKSKQYFMYLKRSRYFSLLEILHVLIYWVGSKCEVIYVLPLLKRLFVSYVEDN